MKKWSKKKSWSWYKEVGWLCGCNYIPRIAVNTIEMWQEETFNEKIINEELTWAEKIGLNSIRVFLHYLVWEINSEGFKCRIDKFLSLANKHKIKVMFVLFDDCFNQEPKLGIQQPPIPGVHNSRWVASPGRLRVINRNTWKGLEKYIKDIIDCFKEDERVIVWDLYNEPGNSGMDEKSLPLVEKTFEWAREISPSQPLTVGVWRGFQDSMSSKFIELSDIVSFHFYRQPEEILKEIDFLKSFKRPILCTEFLCRQVNNNFSTLLPIFYQYKIGWYFWGLVAGKTQTYFWWTSKEGDPVPQVWQHDLLHPDGRPFDPNEIETIRFWIEKQKDKIGS